MIVVVDPKFCNTPLVDALAALGHPLNSDCGGMGKCGKCKVKLVDGALSDRSGNVICPSDGYILACGAVCTDIGATVELLSCFDDRIQINSRLDCDGDHTIAVDLGTTAIEVAIVDRKSGKIAASASANNPQHIYGADVMSRITAANDPTAFDNMRQITLERIESMIKMLCRDKTPADGILSGNPTMTSIVCGVSPQTIGTAPFKLPFSESREVVLESLLTTLKTLPLSSAFIGGDVLAGAALFDIDSTDKPTLFADLGTNGEIILSANGKLWAASAAAGPAFEGAGITCGMVATAGAIVSLTCAPNGHLIPRTLGNIPPIGISASGLCDLVAILTQLDETDSSGVLSVDPFYIDHDRRVFITSEDVRAFMLAKAAFRAACDHLIEHAGLSPSNIDTILVAGSIGRSLNRFSAATVGLFSPILTPKLRFVGNSSLLGAARAACDKAFIEKTEGLSQKIVTVSLADSSLFKDRFIGELHL